MPTFEEIIASLPDANIEDLDKERKETYGLKELNALSQDFGTKPCALVLGAGVSIDAGAPTWEALVSSLMLRALSDKLNITDDKLRALSELFASTLPGSPIVRARYIQGEMQPIDFRNSIRNELYRNTDITRSELLLKLAWLCTDHKFIAQGAGIREILTYNFDVLFEETLAGLGTAVEVTRPFETASPGLCIHHVHGQLPRRPEPDEWIVLSESDYHNQYATPHAWSNVVQLSAFSQRVCIFVGLSFDDPNLRRLLEMASPRRNGSPQKSRHYAFLRQTDPTAMSNRFSLKWSTAGRPSTKQIEKFNARANWMALLTDKARESALDELGIKAVWYKKHAELPGLISSLTFGHWLKEALSGLAEKRAAGAHLHI